MDSLRCSGIWWIPENEENKVHGSLEFNGRKGCHIDLMGDLGFEGETPIILGITSSGKNITLIDNICTTSNTTYLTKDYSQFKTSSVISNTVIEGMHFEDKDKVKFHKVSMNYSNIEEWFWSDDIKIQHDLDDFSIKLNRSSYKTVELSDGFKLCICNSTKFPTMTIAQKEASISQKTYVIISNDNLSKYDDFRKLHRYARNFISLGIGIPISTLDVRATVIGDDMYPYRVKIYFKSKEYDSEKITPFYMLYNYRDIEENLDLFINNWFNVYEKLEDVFDLYFGNQYSNNMYLNNKFSNYIQAIESYHRLNRLNTSMNIDEHESRIASILESAREEHRVWLTSRLAYSNEPTLRDRLKELVRECNYILNLSSNKQKSFIYKVCNTRNYLTHYDPSLRDKCLDTIELIEICRLLKKILQHCLLYEIGFSEEELMNIFNNPNKFIYESL